jgi:hypothetical protein
MEVYANLRDEISGIKGYVLLNLFGLDCSELNTEMYNRYEKKSFSIIAFQYTFLKGLYISLGF